MIYTFRKLFRSLTLCLSITIYLASVSFAQTENFNNSPDKARSSLKLQEEMELQMNLSPVALPKNTLQITSSGAIDPTFNISLTEGYGDVFVMTKQADNKILIGGIFSQISNSPRNNLARLNADGTLDESFNVGAGISGRRIYAIAVQQDGKILVGGFFSAYNNTPAAGLVRLNADGSVDASFNSNQGFNSTVRTIAVQNDGKIWVGGLFTAYNGVDSKRLIRLNADGSIDTAFGGTNGPNAAVHSITIQPDSKILIGGIFSGFNNIITASRQGIIRLNPDASLDSSFSSFSNGGLTVHSIAVQPDGKILLGGIFTRYGNANSYGIVRINNNGTLDTAFAISSGNFREVYSFLLLSDGKIIAAANESGVGKVLRFNANGTVDNTFPISTAVDYLYSIAALPNNQILVGGDFKTFNNQTRRRLARINGNGTVDATYSRAAGTTGIVYDLAIQSNGKIIVVGDFEFVNGAPAGNIVRLNADGSTDSAFNAGASSNALIRAVALDQDERILASGFFSSFNNQQSPGIVRLNSDGTVNNSFNNLSFTVHSQYDVLAQPDGKILLAGLYEIQNNYTPIVRLNPNGSLDSSFNFFPQTEGNVLALQPDGKILLGGTFPLGIVRFNQDGTRDANFGAAVGRTVFDIKIQPDGKILIGGSFIVVENITQNRIARLNPNGSMDSSFSSGSGANNSVMTIFVQPDGKILIGGFFSSYNNVARSGLARLSQDGTLDTTFDVGSGANNAVLKIAGQSDGKTLVGGSFASYNGAARGGLVRLQAAQQNRKTAFDFDGDARADISVFRQGHWYLLYSTSGFASVQFGNGRDELAPADFDGDGKTDVAVFRDGNWYYLRSSDGAFRSVQFGSAGDVPLPFDYDGDGKADIAVFRQGNWYILRSSDNQFRGIQFGISSDKPVPADYDGDGKTDVAVFRDGVWYSINSSNNQFNALQFGATGDKAVPADYDGDGKADQAVYRNGTWYLLRSMQGFTGVQFGNSTDIPTAADYDGDGKADISVFREGNWFRLNSSNGSFQAIQFGITNDKPIPAAFVP